MADIYILTHEFRPFLGGAGIVCERIALTLSRMGQSVEVWAPTYSSEIARHASLEYSVRSISSLKGTRNLSCLIAIARTIIKHRAELKNATLYLGEPGPIAAFFYLGLFSGRWARRQVATLHGSEIERYHKSPLSRWFFKRFIRQMDALHVLSTFNENKLLRLFPDCQGRLIRGFGMHVKGEQLPEFHKETPESDQVRLLCVGRIHPRKGQLPLLEAVKELPSQLQENLEVYFVGQWIKDAYHQQVEALADKLQAKVTFTGGVSDEELENHYQQADIFALTSMPYRNSVEGLGLVYLEAARYALPILAHDIGGVTDVVKNGENGFVCNSNNRDTLTQSLKKLILDAGLRCTLGQNARQRVAACSWESTVKSIFQIHDTHLD